jgi:pimeloyl-ACP methyl ester carboxylesterase
MGAAIAAMYASARPEQVASLVLVELPAVTPSQSLGMADRLAAQLDHLAAPQQHPVFKDVATAAARLRQAAPSLPEALAWKTAERLTEPVNGGVRWRWDAMLRTRAGLAFDAAALTPDDYNEMLARINAPMLLVYGDGSRLGSEAARNGGVVALPGARRVVLPGGHHLHVEAPDALAILIAECVVT